MKIIFEVYSHLIDPVKDLSESITKNFQQLTGGQEQINIGYKIAEMAIDYQTNDQLLKIKSKKEELEKNISSTIGKKCWLKEKEVG